MKRFDEIMDGHEPHQRFLQGVIIALLISMFIALVTIMVLGVFNLGAFVLQKLGMIGFAAYIVVGFSLICGIIGVMSPPGKGGTTHHGPH